MKAKIVTGEAFTIATYTTDDNELRKRITTLAMEGDRLVLFDNVDGKFGGPVLDAALTATSWKDRLLGFNRMASAPPLHDLVRHRQQRHDRRGHFAKSVPHPAGVTSGEAGGADRLP